MKQRTSRKQVIQKHDNKFSPAESTTTFKCHGVVNMHGSGHCSNQKVSNGQVYDKVCRALAQVTISCESENSKTVYNGCHSIFNDKDCEPRGPEHWEKGTSFCFIGHSRVSVLL